MWIWAFTTLRTNPSCSLARSPLQSPSSLSSLLILEALFWNFVAPSLSVLRCFFLQYELLFFLILLRIIHANLTCSGKKIKLLIQTGNFLVCDHIFQDQSSRSLNIIYYILSDCSSILCHQIAVLPQIWYLKIAQGEMQEDPVALDAKTLYGHTVLMLMKQ